MAVEATTITVAKVGNGCCFASIGNLTSGEEDYAKPDYAAEPPSAGKRGKRGAGGYGPAEELGEYGDGGRKQAGYGQQQRSNYGYGDKTYVVAKAHRLAGL